MKTLIQLAQDHRFALITIDETEYWRDDIKAKADKIEAVYLVNLMEPTHLCELAVSYPATLVSNFFTNPQGINEDTLTEYERTTGQDDPFRYFAGNSVFKVVKIYDEHPYQEHELTEENILEYERCNPTIC